MPFNLDTHVLLLDAIGVGLQDISRFLGQSGAIEGEVYRIKATGGRVDTIAALADLIAGAVIVGSARLFDAISAFADIAIGTISVVQALRPALVITTDLIARTVAISGAPAGNFSTSPIVTFKAGLAVSVVATLLTQIVQAVEQAFFLSLLISLAMFIGVTIGKARATSQIG